MRLTIPQFSRFEEVFQHDGETFTLYRLQDTGTGSILWPRFKLMTDPSVPRRMDRHRAYWLAWGIDVRRLRKDAQSMYLQRERPELHDALIAYLRANYNEAWLLHPDGGCLTPAELAAERAELAEYVSQARRR